MALLRALLVGGLVAAVWSMTGLSSLSPVILFAIAFIVYFRYGEDE